MTTRAEALWLVAGLSSVKLAYIAFAHESVYDTCTGKRKRRRGFLIAAATGRYNCWTSYNATPYLLPRHSA